MAWGAEVVIFEPSMLEDMSGSDNKEQTFGLERAVSLCVVCPCTCKCMYTRLSTASEDTLS